MNLKIESTRKFNLRIKKYSDKDHDIIESAIAQILENPMVGVPKRVDLAGVRVVKFKATNHLILLAYFFVDDTVTLLYVGEHENFYRDLKR